MVRIDVWDIQKPDDLPLLDCGFQRGFADRQELRHLVQFFDHANGPSCVMQQFLVHPFGRASQDNEPVRIYGRR